MAYHTKLIDNHIEINGFPFKFMDYARILHDSSWIRHGFFLGSFMDSSWILLGFFHGFFMDSSLVFSWILHGFSMDSPWILHGFFIDSSWILHGVICIKKWKEIVGIPPSFPLRSGRKW